MLSAGNFPGWKSRTNRIGSRQADGFMRFSKPSSSAGRNEETGKNPASRENMDDRLKLPAWLQQEPLPPVAWWEQDLLQWQLLAREHLEELLPEPEGQQWPYF